MCNSKTKYINKIYIFTLPSVQSLGRNRPVEGEIFELTVPNSELEGKYSARATVSARGMVAAPRLMARTGTAAPLMLVM